MVTETSEVKIGQFSEIFNSIFKFHEGKHNLMSEILYKNEVERCLKDKIMDYAPWRIIKPAAQEKI